MEKIISWTKKNRRELVVLGIILLVGAFLRLYKIEAYMTFLGDEGRDVIIVRRFLKYFDLMLVGPGTSIGNMYLGPLYYYLMAPALFLANYSPIGPAIQIAVLGVVSVAFVWLMGRRWWGRTAGLVAAALYAISPTVIIYSRSSWNPNIMPFFSLLCIYSVWKVWQEKKYKWLIVLGVAYAFVLQSHYLGLLLAPTLFIFWFWHRPPLRYTLVALAIFLFLMSPLVIFDARHGWRNFAAIKTFFTVRQETVSIRPWRAIPKAWPIFSKSVTSLVTAKSKPVGQAISVILAVFIIWSLLKRKNILLVAWIAVAILGLGLYKQEIYDHYYGFFFAAPFLLLGGLVSQIFKSKYQKVKIFFIFTLLFLILVNLKSSPLKFPPNQQLRRAKEIAAKIAEESRGQRFNLAVLAERNYQDGYKYFLLLRGAPVVEIDAQKTAETITDQLFVVCEMEAAKCDPTHSPRAEVANFGWSRIEDQWEVFGTKVFKLVHTK